MEKNGPLMLQENLLNVKSPTLRMLPFTATLNTRCLQSHPDIGLLLHTIFTSMIRSSSMKSQLLRLLSPLSPGITDFRNELEALLLDPTFLPDGGLLGFNLEHHYPVQNNSSAYVDLGHVEQCLKGVDAEIMTIAKGLSLHASVRGLITLDSKNGTLLVTEGSIPDFNEVGFSSEGEGVAAYLVWQGAKVVRVSKEWSEEERRHMYINWITRPSRLNRKRKIYPYYGNGPEARYAYNSFCLFIEIGMPGQWSLRPDLKEPSDEEEKSSDSGYGEVVAFTDSQD